MSRMPSALQAPLSPVVARSHVSGRVSRASSRSSTVSSPCGSVDGIDFFNDSKATNVDATLKALTAFPDRKIVLLLGGRDKMTALDELVEACADVCRAVVVYGEAGERFHEAFADSPVDSYLETGMKQALDCACEVAQPGDAIVLSPACASFDEFDSFEHRGQVFKECVSLRTRA